MKKVIFFASVYVLGFSITYGFAYHVQMRFETSATPGFPSCNEMNSVVAGAWCGLVWPIYWPMHLSNALWAKEFSAVEK